MNIAPASIAPITTPPMRIALVIFRGEPTRGGAERYTADLATELAKRGYQVRMLASTFGPPIAGVRNVRLQAKGITRTAKYLRFLRDLQRHLAGERYDIVHAMLPAPGCDVYHPHAHLAAESLASGHLRHAQALKRRATRLAIQLNRKRRLFAEIERQMLSVERPPIILCLSDAIAASARTHFPSEKLRLEKLFNAVDLNRFDPEKAAGAAVRARFNLSKTDVVALMIAQDFKRKGVAQAISALAKIGEKNLKLLIVGKPDATEYIQQAKSLGLADRVIFAGPTDRPVDFYAAADFFVLPTLHDPCSLVVLEALAMGLPVISTKQNGACEIMANGQHGFVLDNAHDIDQLADAMKSLCDGTRQNAMRDQSQLLRPRLSFGHHIERLLEIYRSARALPSDG